MRYWVGVASKEHVDRGVAGGFAQVCHGKKEPLKRMQRGDILIYYAPTIRFGGKEKCRQFVALGRVVGDVYQVEMTPDFHPYRIDVAYYPCKAVSLHDVKESLTFPMVYFRRGLFPIDLVDCNSIVNAMDVDEKVLSDPI